MTLRLNPKQFLFREFGGLEPPDSDWLTEKSYWEDFNQRFFASNGQAYTAENSNVDSWLTATDRAPFACMARELLAELGDDADLAQTDIVLFAHWLPDIHLGTSVTNFAQHTLGITDGFGFAISDRGRSAPLFALHCAARYLTGDRKRAIVMVMDQKHLLYRAPLVEALAPANSATLMVLDRNATADGLIFAGYRHFGGITADMVGETLARICVDFGVDPQVLTLIADPQVAQRAGHTGPVRLQEPRLLCSAPFAVLAQVADQPGEYLILSHENTDLSAVLFSNRVNGGAK